MKGATTVMQGLSWRLLGVGLALMVSAASAVVACGQSGDAPAANQDDPHGAVPNADPCATPNEGCGCEVAGQTADCGKVTSVFGNYVTCSQGHRTCDGDKWGECVGEYLTQKAVSSTQFSALGAATACSDDPCNPYCNVQQDTPGGFDAGIAFSNTDAGLTIGTPTGGFGCTSLTLTATRSTLDVSTISPVAATGNPIGLTATLSPPGCAPNPTPTTWTIDKPDRATIGGTDNTNGLLKLVVPITGTMNVVAYAAGLVSAPLPITVTVHATQTTGVGPNTAAAANQIAKFPGTGTVASTAEWLYPYDNTYYPLGLLAPVMQYKFSTSAVPSNSSPAAAVKFSLRYPKTATEAAATFNYSIIVDEPIPDPQVTIPPEAWSAFTQSIRGNDGGLIIQRWTGGGSGKLERESLRTIHIVDAQLKGTVYYTSYNSTIGGSGSDSNGAVLAIKPAATAPTVAVPMTTGYCTTCHTVNAQGTMMIAAGGPPGGGLYNTGNSAWFDLASGTRTKFYGVTSSMARQYNWGGAYPDGKFFMSSASDNYDAVKEDSQIFDTWTGNAIWPVAGWNVRNAVTPTFSTDGRLLAWSDGTQPNTSPVSSKNLAGTKIRAATFDCQAPPGSVTCGPAPTPPSGITWTVSNYRDLTGSNTNTVGHPSFLPDNSGVVYQKVIQAPTRHPVEGLGNIIYLSPLASNNGARGEVWLSNVPASGTGTSVRLNALNGYDAGGTSYLPTTARDISPALTKYHVPGSSIGWIFENNSPNCGFRGCGFLCTYWACDFSQGDSPIYDYQTNYGPTVNPTSAGGYNWVIFQSRRMYGNIAAGNPWGQEVCGGGGCGPFGVSTTAPLIEPKKLWVSALNESWTPGTDPSHPAFYLPGQELTAGNARGYWVSTPCGGAGASCDSNDDCCGATGPSPTNQCQIDTPVTAPPTKHCQVKAACTAVGGGCDTTADCCTGLVCPSGGGACIATGGAYETQTTTREYYATCPPGSRAQWRFFSWKSTIPAGTSIDFAVQTKAKAADTYQPGTALGVGTANATTATWTHGPQTVNDVLTGSGLSSLPYLLVTMTFNPTPTLAPTLNEWEQKYDCVPAE